MRTDGDAFAAYRQSLSKSPNYTVEIAFDTAFTDLVYFTSHSTSATPAAAVVHASTVSGIGGTSQTLDPLRANSTIGDLTIALNDVNEALTTLFGTKLQASKGLRGKRVRVYVGAQGDAWADYNLIGTQIVYTMSYKDAAYTITCNDIQRSTKKDIFIQAQTTLTSTIPGPGDSGYAETGVTINVGDTSEFALVARGTSYTDGQASTTCVYFKIDNEVFVATGKTATTFTGCKRHWLGTAAARHEVDASVSDSRKTLVTEFHYYEMPALKFVYGILTGDLYNQAASMPSNMSLDIDLSYIDDAAFVTAHPDLYLYSDDTKGFIVRFAGEKRQDGKKFIEEQLLLPMSAFMPVLSTGELSFRRLPRVLSNAGYVAVFDESNVVSYGDLVHDMPSCVNTVTIKWNWDHISEKSTRITALLDTDSVTTHGASPPKVIEYRGLYGNKHTDASIGQVFDTYIDAYSRPPLKMSTKTLHTMSHVEVGDIVRVRLDSVRDMTGPVATTAAIDRSMMVLQSQIDWITGETSFELFGSSGAGVAIARTGNSSDINDTFYTTGLASNREINVANCGAAYNAGTQTLTSFAFTGHADATNSAAIWWHNGDLTIAGSCTWTDNIQLRVKGTRTLNGTLTSIGGGCAGGAGGAASGVNPPVVSIGTAGTAGYFSNQGYGGMYEALIYQASVEGIKTLGKNSVPLFSLYNNAGVLEGLPTDLRGSGGAGGAPVGLYSWPAYTNNIIANGGSGGAGGGGIIEIARGFVAGANGYIDTSGATGTAGTSVSYLSGIRSGMTFYGGSGSGGSPGVWLAILDGNSINTPDSSDLIANSGSTILLGEKIPIYTSDVTQMSSGVYRSFIDGTASESYSDDEPVGSSAFRFMRAPENVTPEEDTSIIAPIPTAVAVVETVNTPQTPAQNLAALTVTVTPPSAGNYSHSEIYYRVNGSADPYIYAGPAKDAYVITAAMDGTAYEVIAKPVSISGYESPEAKRTTITTSNAKGGANLATGNWIASGQTAYDTGTGFYMVNEGGTPKFSIGNSAGNKMTWNGTTLAVAGTITAEIGAIGGWTIGATSLTAGSGANTVGLDSGGSNPAIYAGSATPASAPFRVTQAGAVTGISGTIGGWTLATNTLTSASGGLVLDNTNNRARFTSGSNYVEIGSTGLKGVDNVLGTTFNIPVDGSAPTFSSGIINTTIYNITSSGILRTSSTVGDGTANGYGVLINDTGVKGFEASNSTPTFHLQTSDGSLTAKKGTVAGWTMSTTTLANGTNIILDSSNKAISINSSTYGNQGIQLQYNSGTPRAYIGDGSNKFLKFDGTDVSIGRDSKLLGADAYNNTSIYLYDVIDLNKWYSTVSAEASISTSLLSSYTSFNITSTVTGRYVIAYINYTASIGVYTWNNNRRFKIKAQFSTISSNVFSYIISGSASGQLIGVKIVGSNLYAVTSTAGLGSESLSASLMTIAAATAYIIEVIFISGTSVEILVDGVSKGTKTTTLPTGTTDSQSPLQIRHECTAAITSSLTIGEYKYLQD